MGADATIMISMVVHGGGGDVVVAGYLFRVVAAGLAEVAVLVALAAAVLVAVVPVAPGREEPYNLRAVR